MNNINKKKTDHVNLDKNINKKLNNKTKTNVETHNVKVEAIPKEEIKKENQEEQFFNVLGIIFEITKKRYYFEVLDDKETYKKGDQVIVDTIRGQEIGKVYNAPMRLSEKHLVLPLKPVLKKASDKEIEKYYALKEEAKKAYEIGKEKIKKHDLPMKLINTEFTFDKTKLIFYFTAEGRIDFRDLVKDLANIFKLRIELRQIGVRDEARILGDIGVCGKELCCRTFINKFSSVSIKMARDQGLVINPAKISGVCGRLLCCINYEYSQYEAALKNFPAVNQYVKTAKGDGKVISINPLNEFLYVDVPNQGITKFSIHEVKFNKKETKKIKNENPTQHDVKHLNLLEKE